ncbi:MAG: hypothetical protein JSR86_03350 [Proteobacteria bacterium]|nr:hypothetical protein [Pseudomonadota bacterium]
MTFLEFGLAFGSSAIDRWIAPSGLRDGDISAYAAGTPPNGIMLIWLFRGLSSDLRYLLTGALGVILYGAVIRYVPIRTASRRGALVLALFLAGSLGLAFVNAWLMFPPGRDPAYN